MLRALLFLALTLLAVLALFLVPFLHKARVEASRDRAAADLAALSNALRVYALSNRDALPEPGADLAARLTPHLPPTANPLSTLASGAYFYVPGRTLASPESDIILYQRPGDDDTGGFICRLGAHLEHFDDPAFTAAINALTLPDGTPWTPHLPGWSPPPRPPPPPSADANRPRSVPAPRPALSQHPDSNASTKSS